MMLWILADAHPHDAMQAWPAAWVLLLLLLAGLCAVIFLLARRTRVPQSSTPQPYPLSGDGQEPSSRVTAAPEPIGGSEGTEFSEADYDFDAKILAMLSQKGAPMLQSEVAANLGMKEAEVATWLASMEQREMIQRTWDRKRSTYVIQLPSS